MGCACRRKDLISVGKVRVERQVIKSNDIGSNRVMDGGQTSFKKPGRSSRKTRESLSRRSGSNFGKGGIGQSKITDSALSIRSRQDTKNKRFSMIDAINKYLVLSYASRQAEI